MLLILLVVFKGDGGLPGKMGSRGDTGNDVSVQKTVLSMFKVQLNIQSFLSGLTWICGSCWRTWRGWV